MDHVELAIVLAVDGSASVTYEEVLVDRRRYGRGAARSNRCRGLTGTSVLSLLLWSGVGQHDVITGWTRIAKPGDLVAFADSVDNMPRTVKAGATAIGEALLASLTLLAQVPATRSATW